MVMRRRLKMEKYIILHQPTTPAFLLHCISSHLRTFVCHYINRAWTSPECWFWACILPQRSYESQRCCSIPTEAELDFPAYSLVVDVTGSFTKHFHAISVSRKCHSVICLGHFEIACESALMLHLTMVCHGNFQCSDYEPSCGKLKIADAYLKSLLNLSVCP